MNIPSSTYRVQLSSSFTFKDLKKAIPYLHNLGISTIYASPVFRSRLGSTHGYDVTNPLVINEEIGSIEEFREISTNLKERDMTWLQDIVPNHMAFDGNNEWLWDVLEIGPASEFYRFFDINWEYTEETLNGKVMAPFLGDSLENILNKEELTLDYGKRGFYFKYYDHKYPASAGSYSFILLIARSFLESMMGKGGEKSLKKFDEQIKVLEEAQNDKSEWKVQKEKFLNSLKEDETLQKAISTTIETISTSQELLKELLDEQFFRLVHWKETEKKINYRRFFTINDLICLRMGEQEVFNQYHQFTKQLCDENLIQGLRIDHIDGLFNPEAYLESLRKLFGQDQYLIIEKILEWEEKLPLRWPIQGTSGYGFLAIVNHLFTDFRKQEKFEDAYRKIEPELPEYEDLVYEKKLFILRERMEGELQNLFLLMQQSNLLPDQPLNEKLWIEALAGFLAAFPVYRIYPKEYPLTEGQTKVIENAYAKAKQNLPDHEDALDYILTVFLGKANKEASKMQFFLQRCQQFTGPLAAKGVEDTSFYIFNQLISHNEVGDSPHVFGISSEDFHKRMLQREEHFPHSINTTATHDTKRGEDARMRINVLSEMPEEWFEKVNDWMSLNARLKEHKSGPDNNEEYFIYQVLLGAIPPDMKVDETFYKRTREYLQKVLREAKVHSTWSDPDEQYERDVLDFAISILKNDDFMSSFQAFSTKTTHFGAIYSLGQSVVKITAPGIPDIYQGSELWDLSYVDPDNRRPVDYDLRMSLLQDMQQADKSYLANLIKNYHNGHIKMYTIFKALQERRSSNKAFAEGEYIPLQITAGHDEQAICYARVSEDNWYIIIVPKIVAGICNENEFPLGKTFWEDTFVELPEEFPQRWVNIFTGTEQEASRQLYLAEALANFPVAILKGVVI